jgi:hypothetical protein
MVFYLTRKADTTRLGFEAPAECWRARLMHEGVAGPHLGVTPAFLGEHLGINMINLGLTEFDILATRATRLRRPVGTIVTFLHEDCGIT